MRFLALAAAALVLLSFAFYSSGNIYPTRPSETAWLGDAQACEALASLAIGEAQVTDVGFVNGATSAHFQGVRVAYSQPFCRVRISTTPAIGASINHEIWLPPAQRWNSRFLGTGNGGFAGKIVYDALANGLARGFAVANTDVGTHATSGFIQIAGNEQLRENYHQRAIHQMTQLGKAVAEQYYKRKPEYALFAGCSSGGFEAMTEAANYPTDYNGIVAGAPGIDFAGVGLFQGFSYVQTQGTPGAAIAASKLPAIEAAVLKQCDATDGLEDGQIDDPAHCQVSFEPLLCSGAETDTCLTRPQISALTALRNGPVNPRTGERYYPAFPAGAENAGGARARIAHLATGTSIVDASPGPLTWVLGPQWAAEKWLNFNFDADARQAVDAYAPYAPSNPDLSPFMKAGGKLILFHGLRDANIFAQSSISYYQRVQATLGAAPTAQFSRLFLVPGMDHCAGGIGPNQFGQDNWKAPAANAPETDVIASLDDWVAKGRAPEAMIAAAYRGDTVARTRPLCPYPKVAKYQGGSIDAAGSFACVMP
ncbi:tannase/feruloyl esterase family alpha/beta hydrolase [Pseudomonas sp. NPDC007930]|uniref:tannase/feruloyl esterase family alpha/beta hydrolase n=1 Tax=Pseudomonas sp. NPDC007930 TaxID=3364417 RepID=UPI0036E5DD00